MQRAMHVCAITTGISRLKVVMTALFCGDCIIMQTNKSILILTVQSTTDAPVTAKTQHKTGITITMNLLAL